MWPKLITCLALPALVFSGQSPYPILGWDAFRRYDLFALRLEEVTKQFSSYDRLNKNDDGFAGTYSCLFNETDGRCVIATAQGPGEISSIWFTYENDSVKGVGDIRIELDSQVVLHQDVQSIVNGDLGEPFMWPFVGNTNDTNGGNVIKVPMPYARSMRISTSNNPHFYHVVYRALPPGVNVSTFDPGDSASDVLHSVRSFGVKDPKCSAGGFSDCPYSRSDARSESNSYTVTDGKSAQVTEITGSGIVTELQLRVDEILGGSHVEDDGRAYGKGGGSSMKLQLDPQSRQCRLTRRLDKTVGHQQASVKVDGKDAGQWPDTGPSNNATWTDQALDLNPRLTAGKKAITIENTFKSSDLDINEFSYAAHCKPNNSGSRDWRLADLLNVGPNNVHDEAAHDYQITGQTWSGVRHYHYGGNRSAQAKRSLNLISNLYLKLTFDDHETVHAPIGSFFGSGLGKYDVRSLMLSIDTLADNGAFTSWWPMPFKRSMVVELVNHSDEPVHGSISLIWAPWTNTQSSSTLWGYFSTQYRRSETVTGRLWNFLTTKGQGVAYGVTQTFRGSTLPPNNTLEYLEGNFLVWANQCGKAGPFVDATMHGTGTEDFYESGWYFADAQDGVDGSTAVPFAMPLTGMTGHEFRELDCVGECVSAYRQMLPDSMAFDNGISVNIQHGPVDNNVNAEYESTAFFYRAEDDLS